MTNNNSQVQNQGNEPPVAWNAVLSITVCVACLITVEFLPASLLTPIAEGLNISQGTAGQTLTATAFAAIFSSLFVSAAIRDLDRRIVVLGYSVLLTMSSLFAALSTNFTMMLIGRVLLGIALGGFWAMSASITMRLVSPKDVPKALSIVFGGVSVALVLAAPMGSFLGAIIGWRGVFFLAAGLGIACLVWQMFALPKMPTNKRVSVTAPFEVFKRPGVPAAMGAIFAVFAGQFAFFTYIRPFFELVSGLGVNSISAMLLLFGIANFLGTSLSSTFLKQNLKETLAFAPLILALCATVLITFGHLQIVVSAVIALWGFVFGMVPVGWSTWVTRNMSDDAESAGGLQVAVIQIANTFGAALGGYLLDKSGPKAPFEISTLLLIVAGVIVLTRLEVRPIASKVKPDHFSNDVCMLEQNSCPPSSSSSRIE